MLKKSLLIIFILAIFLVGCDNEIEDFDADNSLPTRVSDSVGDFEDDEKTVQPNKVQQQDSNDVYINNRKLTSSEIQQLEQIYGKKSVPGNYWYDSMSGFYGVWHGPTLGVILPGYDFGELPEDASNGDTNIFINGRELPENDVRALELLFGVQRSPDGGRLWLDAQGNIGIEGSSTPLANLYLAYSQRAKSSRGTNYGSGYGSSGDNYWAGNFGSYGNEEGGFGYVTVDGVSVTYGG
ncbi:hypothetical protein J4216_03480 [Candidatus Woesearchaeota archaeon]|nr:hypothetical protein [Candidatus Woesearchaeota archaeon]